MSKTKRAGIISGFFLMVFLLGAFSNQEDKKGVFPGIEGFELIQEYPVYHPDNLWDYINGAADAYLEFGFMDVHIAEYVADDVRYKAEVYRHKDATNGFGIYALERSTDYHFIKLGVQGYSEGSLVHFVKGPYYVKVTTYNETDQSGEILMRIAEKIESVLEGSSTFPEFLLAFPAGGKIENAEGFVAQNFLGYSFMGNVFTAEYERGYTLFIFDTKEPEKASEILQNMLKRATGAEEEAPGIHRIEDKYNGTLFFGEYGKNLIGGYGKLNKAQFIEHYKQIVEALK